MPTIWWSYRIVPLPLLFTVDFVIRMIDSCKRFQSVSSSLFDNSCTIFYRADNRTCVRTVQKTILTSFGIMNIWGSGSGHVRILYTSSRNMPTISPYVNSFLRPRLILPTWFTTWKRTEQRRQWIKRLSERAARSRSRGPLFRFVAAAITRYLHARTSRIGCNLIHAPQESDDDGPRRYHTHGYIRSDANVCDLFLFSILFSLSFCVRVFLSIPPSNGRITMILFALHPIACYVGNVRAPRSSHTRHACARRSSHYGFSA